MVFFHRMREGRVVLEPATFEFIKEEGRDGHTRIPKWGKTVTFNAIQSPDGYRYKNKSWRGKTEVTDGRLAAALMTHRGYGRDFIAFSDDGGDAELLDSFFERRPTGDVYCWLTDRSFINEQGAAGHRQSKAFQEAVEKYLDSINPA